MAAPQGISARREDRGRGLIMFYIAAFAAVVVAAVLLCIFVFFRVEHVEVVGGESYRLRDLLSVLDIPQGENLVLLPTEHREAEIVRRFPYIRSAKIEKHLPSTVTVRLEETETCFSVQTAQGYLYVDDAGKILQISDHPEPGSITVHGGTAVTSGLSESLTFEDPEMTEMMLYIGRQLRSNDITGITSIDLRSRYEITMTYDLRIVFRFGNLTNMDQKLDMGIAVLNEMLSDGSVSSETRGEIDLTNTDLNFASFRAYAGQTAAGGAAGRPEVEEDRKAASGSDGGDGDETDNGDGGTDGDPADPEAA